MSPGKLETNLIVAPLLLDGGRGLESGSEGVHVEAVEDLVAGSKLLNETKRGEIGAKVDGVRYKVDLSIIWFVLDQKK